MRSIKRFLPVILLGAIFLGIIYLVPPPRSWSEASIPQILIFFLPLLIFLCALINYYSQNLLRSFCIALGLMVILVLKSIELLNWFSFALVAIATIILAVYFRESGLTSRERISKLTRFRRKNG